MVLVYFDHLNLILVPQKCLEVVYHAIPVHLQETLVLQIKIVIGDIVLHFIDRVCPFLPWIVQNIFWKQVF